MEETTNVNIESNPTEAPKKERKQISKFAKWTICISIWIILFAPYIGLRFMLFLADDGNLPSIEILENPDSKLASQIYTSDGKMIGKYFIINRTNVSFNQLSPHLVNALVATEDERFYEHSGVDVRATFRVAKGVLTGDDQGGGSTITQQLAKMLFPREKNLTKWGLVKRKFKEWIIADRLETSYTKNEIIAMYFNTFDFLNNAVGINSAAQVYFGKKPIELDLHESAMLVGMAKNPSLFNPLRDPDTVMHRREVVYSQMKKSNFINQKQYDSLRNLPLGLNYTRVDHQTGLAPYFRESLRGDVTQLFKKTDFFCSLYFYGEETEEGKNYLKYDWKDVNGNTFDIYKAIEKRAFQTIHVYNKELNQHFQLRVIDAAGDCKVNFRKYRYCKTNGEPYDIYSDGLKIYTTIDSRMQEYAEYAVAEHLKFELQEDFFENNAKWKNPPFSNDLKPSKIDTIMMTAMRQSQLYKKLTGKVCARCERPKKFISEKDGYYVCRADGCNHKEPVRSEAEIKEIFNTTRKMKVFDWHSPNYEKDTVFTPMDSIRYYKGLLRAAMVSIDPKDGRVKAWVGGPHFQHFKYDMVKKGRRQVGSTFKPFIYATALEVTDGKITPCTMVPDIQHCVETPYNQYRNKMWCPGNSGSNFSGELTPIPYALASSMNNITAYIIGQEDGAMPELVYNRVAQLGIDTSLFEPVPSMALGVFDLSVYQMVGGMCSFVNDGVYVDPIYIEKIVDKEGNVIYAPDQDVVKVWNERTAYTMLSIMKKTTAGIQHPTLKNKKSGRPAVGGTALRIRGKKTEKRPYAGLKMPIAGKTGTTQNQSDGWFMGLTPDLVTGVWVGAEDRSVRFRSLRLGMGTNMALPIFGYYMNQVYADSTLSISQGDFEKPPSIIGDPLDCFFQQKSMFNPGDIGDGDNLDWNFGTDSTGTGFDEDFNDFD